MVLDPKCKSMVSMGLPFLPPRPVVQAERVKAMRESNLLISYAPQLWLDLIKILGACQQKRFEGLRSGGKATLAIVV
jgi:hypothetical protein